MNLENLNQKYIQRGYSKILTLVSIVGGLLKSLMVVGAFITKPFSKLSMRSNLVNRLFTFDIKRENKKLKQHEIGFYEDIQENEQENKNCIKHSKSMNSGQKDNIDQNLQYLYGISRLNTNFRTDDNLISNDQIQLQTSEQNNNYYKKSPIDTNNNLDNLKSEPFQKREPSSKEEKYNYFRNSQNQIGHEDNSLKKQSSLGDQQIFKSQIDEQFKPQRNYNDIKYDDQNNMFIDSPIFKKRVNQIKYQEKISKTIGNKNESTIKSQHEEEEQSNLKEEISEKIVSKELKFQYYTQKKQRSAWSMFNFDIDKDQAQVPIQLPSLNSPQQKVPQESVQEYQIFQQHLNIQHKKQVISQEQIAPSILYNISTEKQTTAGSTKPISRKGPTQNGQIKKLKHSHSFDDNKSNFVKERDEYMQRRNVDFDRDKRIFSKKGTGNNNLSLNHNTINNEDQKKQNIEYDNSLSKKSSLKKLISKKETLESQKQEEPHNETKQSQSSSKRIKSFFSTKTKEITNLIRLNIRQKQKQSLENNKTNDPNEPEFKFDKKNEEENKELNQKRASNKKSSDKKFEGILNEKQEKSIVFYMIDYIKYFFSCSKDTPKVKQIKYTNKKVKKRLDIIYILEKLIEIDKLKVLLLNPDQINLFNYMPKEFVSCDIKEGKDIDQFFKSNKFQTWSLLCADRSTLDKYSNACIAYHHIQQNGNKTKIDKKLIQMLDPQVKRYFNKTLIQRDEIKNYLSLQANYSLEEKHKSEQNTLENHESIENQLDNRLQNLKYLQERQGNNTPFLLQNQQSPNQTYSQNDKSQMSKSTQQQGLDSVQRQNSQISNFFNQSPQKEYSAFQMLQRKESQQSPNDLFIKSPLQHISKNIFVNNQIEADFNFLQNKKIKQLTQNNQKNTSCEPTIQESKNMISSEKQVRSLSPKILKEIIHPLPLFEQRNSQQPNVQSIAIKSDKLQNKHINLIKLQQLDKQSQIHSEQSSTDHQFIPYHTKGDIIKLDNSQYSSLKQIEDLCEQISPVRITKKINSIQNIKQNE